MSRDDVKRIADAVLYEGYILYPYRASVKNRQRWSFGGLYPEAWGQAGSSDISASQTECLIHGTPATVFEASIRFLHLTARQVGQVEPPRASWSGEAAPPFRSVESLQIAGKHLHTWQEAEEREVALGEVSLGQLTTCPFSKAFTFPGGQRWELLRETGDEIVGVLVRKQQALEGLLEAEAVALPDGLYRVRLRVVNRTPLEDPGQHNRDEVLLRSLASTHSVLGVRQGDFVSLLDPPECCRQAAAACRNVGTWPVLVGAEGQKDTMLSSPIILYDYPQVALESPGDFFDGTEIDEMLTLRILTLTDEEKRSMAGLDERAAALLARTEALAREHLLGLHGTLRSVRPLE
jgi:hydrogenase maturation protease